MSLENEEKNLIVVIKADVVSLRNTTGDKANLTTANKSNLVAAINEVKQSSTAISNGDKGEITVAGGGLTWTIKTGVVTAAKLGGDITAAGKILLTAANLAAQRQALNIDLVPNVDARQRDSHLGTQGLSTISGITSQRILGRFSAATGAGEEISLSSDFTITGGVLRYVGSTGPTGATNLDGLTDVNLSSPANDDFLQRKSGNFVNRSILQVKADLGISGTNTGDETTSRVKSLLGISTLSGSNTGDETTSSIAAKLGTADNLPEGSTNKYYPPSAAASLAVIENEYINIARLMSGGTDITTALNAALAQINQSASTRGGQIFIPRGDWTTNGGHQLDSGIEIRGVGCSEAENDATRITLNVGGNNYIFGLDGNEENARIKDLALNLRLRTTNGIGFYVTGASNTYHHSTELGNVGFFGGRYGIKIEASNSNSSPQNDGFSANNCKFIGCRTAFYSDTLNCSIYITKPEIGVASVDTPNGFYTGGIAFEIPFCGVFVCRDYHIYGTNPNANMPQTNGSIVLYTVGAFNKILFENGQDEGVQYFYTNAGNAYSTHPIVVRDSVVQSIFYPSGDASFVASSCKFINSVDYPTFQCPADKTVHLYLEGQNFVETRTVASSGYDGGEIVDASMATLTGFSSNYAALYNTDGSLGESTGSAVRKHDFALYPTINATQGSVDFRGTDLGSAQTTHVIYNFLLNKNVVGTTLDPPFIIGANPSAITVTASLANFSDHSEITLTLSAASAVTLTVGFTVNIGRRRFS